MGALGPERCFYLVQRDGPELHLPSDLAGIQPLTFRAGRSDGNLVAALGPACNRVRNTIRTVARRQAVAPTSAPATPSTRGSLDRYVDMWNGSALAEARRIVSAQGVPMSVYEVDDESRDAWEGFKKIFYFLDSMSEAVLAGDIEEDAARSRFGKEVASTWNIAVTALPPPNHVEEYWSTLPAIAELAQRWGSK